MTDKRVRLEWVGDETDFPYHLGNGALFVLVHEESRDETGLYLPDGTWKPLEPEPKKRMGFS